MRLTDLVEVMPVCSQLELKPDADPALSQPDEYPGFVAAPINVIGVYDSTRPIVVISAPGAVGKTTLAQHLAAGRATALWDLSKLAIGDNTFLGTLARAFGAAALGEILQGLTSGRSLFVFDAFDEAELLSGTDRVEGFVREVHKHVHGANMVAAVMLARTETASLLDLVLHDAAGDWADHVLLEIDYFDERSAKKFVGRQLTAVHESDAHVQHHGPFDEALDAVFTTLGATLVTDGAAFADPIGRSFLGYAPVLQAIAAHFAGHSNYHEVSQAVEAAKADSFAGITPRLMQSLLRREQGKFMAPIRERLGENADAVNWVNMYNAPDQVRRVFLYILGMEEAVQPQDSTRPEWHEAFAEALKSFVPNHPFLRGRAFAGPAFRDYVCSRLLVDAEIGPIVEAWLEDQLYVPTPLFCDFYLEACDGTGSGRHAGYLYESVLARHGFGEVSLIAMIAPEGEPGLHCMTINGGTEAANDFEIRLRVDESSPLAFRQRLRAAVISADGPVSLSAAAGFELVEVEIDAGALHFSAPTITARGRGMNEAVLLRSRIAATYPPALRVDVKPDAILRVAWPESRRHPWVSFAVDDVFEVDEDLDGAFIALRRILKWFRKDRKEDLARFKELIDNVVVGGSIFREEMRDFLVAKRVIHVDAKFYYLDPGIAESFGINWAALRAPEPPAALVPLLQEFLRGRTAES